MEIKPYVNNAKKHSKKQIEAIAVSIKEFGFLQPVVVDKKGVIIVGHGRYAAAKLLEMEDKDIPVVIADISSKKAAAYRLADNKLNESTWNMPLVFEEMRNMDVRMIPLTGFNLDTVERGLTTKPEKKGKSKGVILHTCPSCGTEFDSDGNIKQ